MLNKNFQSAALLVLASGFSFTEAQTYAPPYGQCGPVTYGGPIICPSGYQCEVVNYSE